MVFSIYISVHLLSLEEHNYHLKAILTKLLGHCFLGTYIGARVLVLKYSAEGILTGLQQNEQKL